jgi:hypothetical protein
MFDDDKEPKGMRLRYCAVPVDLALAWCEAENRRPGILSRAADLEETDRSEEE